MNTKLFLKTAWLFILGLLAYLFFVIFFLSPKINSYLSETEILNTKSQFNKIVSIIQNKIRTNENNNSLKSEIDFLLSSVLLGKTGTVFIFDGKGNVIIDPSGDFSSLEFNKVRIDENKLLFEELKNAYIKRESLEFNWNRIYDPNNHSYKKLSWVEYNPKLDWYIASNIYKEDFSTFVSGINNLILNMSLLLFGLLGLIGMAVMFKVVIPINKMFHEVKKASNNSQNENKYKELKSKDEIGFLATQFNSLLDQVETSKRTIEEQVEVKTKEYKDRLYIDELTGLKK